MKKIFFSVIILFIACSISAQDKTVQELKDEASKEIKKDPNDTIPKVWKKGGLLSLTFNQAALSNWSAGGENSSISLNSYAFVYAFYKKNRHAWDNSLELAYGFVNTTSQGSRKTDDRMDLVSKYGYDVGKNWFASLLFNYRSQFAPGYNYPDQFSKIKISDFLAPAYILLSPGMDYKPSDNFSLFLSPVTARWVIVNDDSLASVGAFGVDSGKNVKSEFGAYVSVNFIQKISANAVYKGRLDLFSNYKHDPQNIDVYMTNILAVKVSKIITMNLSVNLIYDDDVKTVKKDGTPGGAALQLQEIMGIGFAFKF